ncbi:hypothetical protein GCM10009872_14440 [Actinopolymorpha rutila]
MKELCGRGGSCAVVERMSRVERCSVRRPRTPAKVRINCRSQLPASQGEEALAVELDDRFHMVLTFRVAHGLTGDLAGLAASVGQTLVLSFVSTLDRAQTERTTSRADDE